MPTRATNFNIADAFDTDIFDQVTLIQAMDMLPPSDMLTEVLGIFPPVGIDTKTVMIDEYNGGIALVPETARNAPGTVAQTSSQTARAINCGHVKLTDRIYADDIIGKRAFGEETMDTVQRVTNQKLLALKKSIDITREFRRINALQGIIYDSDGSTELVNLYTDYGVSETTTDFAFATTTTDVQARLMVAKVAGEAAVGGTVAVRGWNLIAGATWFNAFVAHESVREAYQNWSSNAFMRSDNRAGFSFNGVNIYNSNMTVSTVSFIPATEGRLFPDADVYGEYFAPAPAIDAVGDVGLPYYGRSAIDKMNTHIELEAESNPLPLCHMPAACIKLTQS